MRFASKNWIFLLLIFILSNCGSNKPQTEVKKYNPMEKAYVLLRTEGNENNINQLKDILNSDFVTNNISTNIVTYSLGRAWNNNQIFTTAYNDNYDYIVLIDQVAKFTIDNKTQVGGKYQIRSYHIKSPNPDWVDLGQKTCNVSVKPSIKKFAQQIVSNIVPNYKSSTVSFNEDEEYAESSTNSNSGYQKFKSSQEVDNEIEELKRLLKLEKEKTKKIIAEKERLEKQYEKSLIIEKEKTELALANLELAKRKQETLKQVAKQKELERKEKRQKEIVESIAEKQEEIKIEKLEEAKKNETIVVIEETKELTREEKIKERQKAKKHFAEERALARQKQEEEAFKRQEEKRRLAEERREQIRRKQEQLIEKRKEQKRLAQAQKDKELLELNKRKEEERIAALEKQKDVEAKKEEKRLVQQLKEEKALTKVKRKNEKEKLSREEKRLAQTKKEEEEFERQRKRSLAKIEAKIATPKKPILKEKKKKVSTNGKLYALVVLRGKKVDAENLKNLKDNVEFDFLFANAKATTKIYDNTTELDLTKIIKNNQANYDMVILVNQEDYKGDGFHYYQISTYNYATNSDWKNLEIQSFNISDRASLKKFSKTITKSL